MTERLTRIVGESFAPLAGFILLFLAVILAIILVFWILRRLAGGTFVAGGRNRVARLSVMDAAAVDNRRRLVLIRRDDIEHLILIGGPTDVVVETNIRQTSKVAPRAQPVVDVAENEPADEPIAPAPPVAPKITPPSAPAPRAAVVPPPPPMPVEPRPVSPYQAAPRPPLRPQEPPAHAPAPQPIPQAQRAPQVASGAALAGAAAVVTSTGIPAPNFTAAVTPPGEPKPEFDLTSEGAADLGDVRVTRNDDNGNAPHISLSEPDFSFDGEINLEDELHDTLSGELNIAPNPDATPEPPKSEPGGDKLEDEMERLLDELSHPSKK
ncbi:MAG: flagellar biosynthetic protein FliO [Phyllobacterium sp.]